MLGSVCEHTYSIYSYSIHYMLLYMLDPTQRSTSSRLRQHVIVLCYRTGEQSRARPSQLVFIKRIKAVSRIAITMVTVSSHAEASGCVCDSREKRTTSGKEIHVDEDKTHTHHITFFFLYTSLIHTIRFIY